MDFRDLVVAARVLRKSPVFALTAALTIALGVGASTAIFSVTNAVLLRQLPYRLPLVILSKTQFVSPRTYLATLLTTTTSPLPEFPRAAPVRGNTSGKARTCADKPADVRSVCSGCAGA